VNRFYPGRADQLRSTNTQETKATTVVSMRIEDASAKIRAKGVADDEEDYDHPVWAGVIPVRTIIGANEPCPRLLPEVASSEALSIYREGRRLDEALLEAQRVYEDAAER
jgi:hypothetical protein